MPHREGGIVRLHGGGAHQHRARLGAQTVHVGACRLATDPLGFAAGHGGAAVEAGRELEREPRPAAAHALEKTPIERLGLIGVQPPFHRNPGGAQACRALPGHERIRVFDGIDHAAHAGGDQRLHTGRRSAAVIAGFKGHKGGCAAGRITGRTQGMHLGMRSAGHKVRALPDHRAVADQHAADARIGVRAAKSLTRQRQGLLHPEAIAFGHALRSVGLRASPLIGRSARPEGSAISSGN